MQLRILVGKNSLALLNHQLAALAARYAAEQQQVLDVVAVGIKRNGVREVRADGAVNIERVLIAVVCELLYDLELLGG